MNIEEIIKKLKDFGEQGMTPELALEIIPTIQDNIGLAVKTIEALIKEVNERDIVVQSIEHFKREARNAIRVNDAWQQEFNGNEIPAIIAMYQASTLELRKKEKAVKIGVDFIARFEVEPEPGDTLNYQEYVDLSFKALDDINKALVGESLETSMKKVR